MKIETTLRSAYALWEAGRIGDGWLAGLTNEQFIELFEDHGGELQLFDPDRYVALCEAMRDYGPGDPREAVDFGAGYDIDFWGEDVPW